MRKILIYSCLILIGLSACRKESANLNVDWNNYPIDIHEPTSDLDNWIKTHFNDAWNIAVDYRFDRFYTDVNRNIAPIKLEKVQPSLQMVVDGFLEPYSKVIGDAFIKKYVPKLWVLYGSGSYNTDGSIVLGTMTNARQLTLYDLNNLNHDNSENIRRRLRTVHHEFMHSLNQTVPIPRDFQAISGPNYDPSWTGKTDNDVRDFGFINPYSSSAYTEDFAEMLAHIVVEGPEWYKNYLFWTNETGRERLKKKEESVYTYMLTNFNIDIYELQKEVQNQLETIYDAKQPSDLPLRFTQGKVNTIMIDYSDSYYNQYGASDIFTAIYEDYVNSTTDRGRVPDNMYLEFTSPSKMTLNVNYHNPSSGATFTASYDFDFSINTSTGVVTFTKSATEGTSTTHGNGQTSILLPGFQDILMPYLTTHQFVAKYLPLSITPYDALYQTFVGFSVVGDDSNYFYGPVTYN